MPHRDALDSAIRAWQLLRAPSSERGVTVERYHLGQLYAAAIYAYCDAAALIRHRLDRGELPLAGEAQSEERARVALEEARRAYYDAAGL